jgi:acyl carrier protein
VITIGEIRNRVEAELRGKGPSGSEINENTEITDLGLSSLQISEIVFGMEEDHEVEFDAALAADAVTLGDLLAVANRALAEKAREQPGAAAPAVIVGGSAPEATENGTHPMQPESVRG